MSEFITPPEHINFTAKKLFENAGEIIDGSIAYIDLNGGGPKTPHTHEHNHLFIVTEGEAEIRFPDTAVTVRKNESYLVKGTIPHSVWSKAEKTVMIGISVK